MNYKRRKPMSDPKDCEKYNVRLSPSLKQDLDVWDRSAIDHIKSIKITNSKKISDFWGIRR